MPPVELAEPVEYNDDAEIPFQPIGNSSLIGNSVERVRRVRSQLRFARKTFFLDAPRNEDAETWRIPAMKSLVEQERTIRGAHHPHIVQLIQTYIYNQYGPQKSQFAIIMDLADANLSKYLLTEKHINTQWFSCLSEGLRHLHTMNIVHGSIKPTNILVKDGRVILTDIGCFSQKGVGVMIKRRSRINPVRDYCAPEAIGVSEISKQGDIFSLGAVFLEMLIISYDRDVADSIRSILECPCPADGILSYAKNIDQVHVWIDGLTNDESCTKYKETIKKMIHPDKAQRPAAEDLIEFFPSCKCQYWIGRLTIAEYLSRFCTIL